MKPFLFFFALLLFASFTGCTKDAEDPKPDASYIGTLRLEYARTFPEFNTLIIMDVELDKSGEVNITEPDQKQYDSGEDIITIEQDQIKQRETGTITITSLSGTYKEFDGVGYLSVHAFTLIDGTQTTWGFDEDLGWIQVSEVPFSLDDPVESPMNFKIDEAVLMGSQLGKTLPVPLLGSQTFTWTLLLDVKLE